MHSAAEQARKLVDRLRAVQQRQAAARKAWGGVIAEFQQQADVCAEVVQKGLRPSKNDTAARIWSEREPLTLIVLLGEQQAEQVTNRERLAMARFYLDAYTCQVVVDRKRAGVPEKDKRGRSGFKKSADLGDVQNVTLGAFVRELLRFLEWALVGEGKGSQPWQFTDPESS